MSIKTLRQKPPKFKIDPAKIPDELKQIPRWVVWKWVWNEKREKWDKPPFSVNGFKCDHTDPAHQVTFSEALAASGGFDGIGLSMGSDGGGYVGLDIDNCRDRDSGFLSVEAQSIVDELGTFCEISPSGEGVKLWLRGDYDKAKWGSEVGNIEVYRDGRYFTVFPSRAAASVTCARSV
jgi:putative DNA primase/helicase